MSDKGITLEGLAAAVDALRQELATWKALAHKQDALTTAQQAAVDSGATATKIGQIATNAAAIVSLTSSKQDTLSTAQLAAVNSGITSAAVQQISTNTGAIATKAADSAVVHLAGTETISGAKTWTGNNNYEVTINMKDAAAVSAGGYGVGLNFFDYAGNRYGYIQPHITSGGTKNIVFGNSASGYLEFATPLVPYANNIVNLGTSDNKWKTLNGINPGALGIPNKDNKVNIASSFTDLTGGNNYYIPPADGFVSINADTDIYCAVVSSTHNTSFWRQSAVATSTGYASVTIPVKAGLHLLAKINSTAAIYAEFFPCLGNV